MKLDPIVKFEHLCEQLTKAIECDDLDHVTALDRQITEMWTHLLQIRPQKEEFIVELIEFFLRQIIKCSQQSEVTIQSAAQISKLTEILQSKISNQQ